MCECVPAGMIENKHIRSEMDETFSGASMQLNCHHICYRYRHRIDFIYTLTMNKFQIFFFQNQSSTICVYFRGNFSSFLSQE